MKKRVLVVVLSCIFLVSILGSLEVMAKTAKKPIILVHGIGGSKFWEDVWWGDDLLWYDLDQSMFSGSDDFLDPLKLSTYGNIIDWDVKTLRDFGYSSYISEGLLEGVISKISIPLMDDVIIFSELIDHLENNGYQLGVNLFAFPYDWRRDINEIYYLLDEVIEIAKQQSGWDKVDIIAHSMGGLVTKRYLLAGSYYRNKVDTFISLGTPYFGSPQAAWALTVGDNFAVEVIGINLGISETKAKELVKNFPSNYQLFPSQMYFDQVINYANGAYYTWNNVRYNSYFCENGYDFDSNYSYFDQLTHSQVGNAIANRYNDVLYSKNAYLHNIIDGVSVSNLGVKHYTIANWNIPTLYVMRTSGSSSFDAYQFGNGDGTVPYFSAQDWGTTLTDRYYVNDTDHQYLPSTPAVRSLIVSLLNDNSPILTSTAVSEKANVETYSLDKEPGGLNGLLMLIKTDEMPLVYKKNDPTAKIGQVKIDKKSIKTEKSLDAKSSNLLLDKIYKNTLKKGSYIRKYGEVYVVYLADKDDYVVKFNGKGKASIQIREFTNSKEVKLSTLEEIELNDIDMKLEFDLKNKKLMINK